MKFFSLFPVGSGRPFLCFVFFCCFVSLPALSQDRLTLDEQNNIDIFERTQKSVVYVSLSVSLRNNFSLRAIEQPAGTGTGFVWDKTGLIVSNFHVIESSGSGGTVNIRLHDFSVYGSGSGRRRSFERPCLAENQRPSRKTVSRRSWRLLQFEGRQQSAGHRQSFRVRLYFDDWSHQRFGQGNQGAQRTEDRQNSANRRRHQPRQFGRSVAQFVRGAHRGGNRHRFRFRFLGGNRFRHSRQYRSRHHSPTQAAR